MKNDYEATAEETRQMCDVLLRGIREIQKPFRYPRLVHRNESGSIWIWASAPGKFFVTVGGVPVANGTPEGCKNVFNHLVEVMI